MRYRIGLTLNQSGITHSDRGGKMTRDEFLRTLNAELNQNVSADVIREQLAYYSAYIDDALAAGKKEAEVMEELGDPRLLARTIMDAALAGGDIIARENTFRYEDADIPNERRNPFSGDASFGNGFSEDPFQDGRFQEEKQRTAWDFFNRGPWQAGMGGDDAPGTRTASGDTVEGGRSGNENSGWRSFLRNFFAIRQLPFGHGIQFSGFGCFAVVISVFVVLNLIGWIIGGLFSLIAPVILPILVVLVLLWFFKGMFGGR